MLWFVCSLRNNLLNAEAAKYLGEGLRENKGLTALEYATCHQPSLFLLLHFAFLPFAHPFRPSSTPPRFHDTTFLDASMLAFPPFLDASALAFPAFLDAPMPQARTASLL